LGYDARAPLRGVGRQLDSRCGCGGSRLRLGNGRRLRGGCAPMSRISSPPCRRAPMRRGGTQRSACPTRDPTWVQESGNNARSRAWIAPGCAAG